MNRFTSQEIENSICTSHPKEEILPNYTLVFTILGEHTINIDTEGYPNLEGYPALDDDIDKRTGKIRSAERSIHAYAKKVRYNNQVTYYIKCDRNNKLYNPLKADLNIRHSNVTRSNIALWKFKSVPESVFEKYIEFLKTRKPVLYSIAQRNMGE